MVDADAKKLAGATPNWWRFVSEDRVPPFGEISSSSPFHALAPPAFSATLGEYDYVRTSAHPA
jgi:hypothetical protein